jgi:hypothetical protein
VATICGCGAGAWRAGELVRVVGGRIDRRGGGRIAPLARRGAGAISDSDGCVVGGAGGLVLATDRRCGGRIGRIVRNGMGGGSMFLCACG